MEAKVLYETSEVCFALDEMPRETLRGWTITRRFIQPIQPSQGQGKTSLFDRDDIYALAVFKHLMDEAGISREVAGKMVSSWFRPRNSQTIKMIVFYKEKSEAWFPVNYSSLDALVEVVTTQEKYKMAIVVNFETIRDRIDSRLPE